MQQWLTFKLKTYFFTRNRQIYQCLFTEHDSQLIKVVNGREQETDRMINNAESKDSSGDDQVKSKHFISKDKSNAICL